MSELWKELVKILDDIGEASGCHRLPERSFFFKGHQFPVCARCTGVAIGQLSAIIINAMKSVPLFASIAMLSIMGADWGIQEIGIKKSNNIRRLITGFLGGFGLFSIYAYIFKMIIKVIRKTK